MRQSTADSPKDTAKTLPKATPAAEFHCPRPKRLPGPLSTSSSIPHEGTASGERPDRSTAQPRGEQEQPAQAYKHFSDFPENLWLYGDRAGTPGTPMGCLHHYLAPQPPTSCAEVLQSCLTDAYGRHLWQFAAIHGLQNRPDLNGKAALLWCADLHHAGVEYGCRCPPVGDLRVEALPISRDNFQKAIVLGAATADIYKLFDFFLDGFFDEEGSTNRDVIRIRTRNLRFLRLLDLVKAYPPR